MKRGTGLSQGREALVKAAVERRKASAFPKRSACRDKRNPSGAPLGRSTALPTCLSALRLPYVEAAVREQLGRTRVRNKTRCGNGRACHGERKRSNPCGAEPTPAGWRARNGGSRRTGSVVCWPRGRLRICRTYGVAAAKNSTGAHTCQGDERCRTRPWLPDFNNPNYGQPGFVSSYRPPEHLRISCDPLCGKAGARSRITIGSIPGMQF